MGPLQTNREPLRPRPFQFARPEGAMANTQIHNVSSLEREAIYIYGLVSQTNDRRDYPTGFLSKSRWARFSVHIHLGHALNDIRNDRITHRHVVFGWDQKLQVFEQVWEENS